MSAEPSRPPSPLSHPDSPNLIPMTNFSLDNLFSEDGSEYANAFTLLDTLETYWDARLDLLQRNISRRKDRLKMRAELALNEIFKGKPPSSDALAENFEREVAKLKLKVSKRMASLSTAWQSAKVVRTRDKISFFFGVMSLVSSALLFGLAPQYKLQWHYFLFDLCYFVTILNFVFIWVFPRSPSLFVACYCLSHGVVASAIITWRNSLVFHDADKVTSLFIHIYPPFTFTVIRHFYPGAEDRFPALKELPRLHPWRALLLSSAIYLVWQVLYWKLVYVDRRKKVESGQRTTSLYWMLNKPGLINNMLSKFKPENRAFIFMLGQFVYSVLTDVPPVFILYDSPLWSGSYLLFILSVSVWNGGGFYIEVFGRKFERELETLRKELAEAQGRSQRSSPIMDPETESEPVSPLLDNKHLGGEEDGLPATLANGDVPFAPLLERMKKDT
ncbi:hypothetical protein F5148DRAFT_1273104 [Russula earlei]|uniref:Uncharacterized protein n=1 Tax=Russula earlei TaxID=71964 RepID=A0ACC0UPG0_9AGAM|nr:hypothetical protein F5148DRAFT_1273104 [Russula earlei]